MNIDKLVDDFLVRNPHLGPISDLLRGFAHEVAGAARIDVTEPPATVFAALHNPQTEESEATTISIHWSRTGAEKAVTDSRAAVKDQHEEYYANEPFGAPCPWDHFHAWSVYPVEILP